METQELKTEF